MTRPRPPAPPSPIPAGVGSAGSPGRAPHRRWPALAGAGGLRPGGPYYDERLYHQTAELRPSRPPRRPWSTPPPPPSPSSPSGPPRRSGATPKTSSGATCGSSPGTSTALPTPVLRRLDGEPACRCSTRRLRLRHPGVLPSPRPPRWACSTDLPLRQVPVLVRGWLPHPEFDAQLAEVPALARQLRGEPVRRYNPVFQERRPRRGPVRATGALPLLWTTACAGPPTGRLTWRESWEFLPHEPRPRGRWA